MQNLNNFAIFAKVAEKQGFTAAAADLRMSASLVSKRISQLEGELGVQLINRSTRRLVLTEAGNDLYQICLQVISLIETAQFNAMGLADTPQGTLKVHSAVGVGQGMIATAVNEFKVRHPGVKVIFHVSSDRAELLDWGYDVVIRTADITDSSLACREFDKVRYCVVAADSYLARAGRPQEPHDLADHNCLIHLGRRSPYEWRFLDADGPYTVRVSGDYACNNGVTIQDAALRGIGIARLPEYVLGSAPAAHGLSVIFDDCLPTERTVKAFYPRTRFLPAKVEAFLDCLESVSTLRI